MSKHLHIFGEKENVAETVLLPGDPLRAKWIAETFLTDVVCYNEVRGMYGYTGYYNGKRVSIQGTGMGMPSISIYATELIKFYDAKRLIRIGSCGSLSMDVNIRDLILAQGACTDSNINKKRFGGDNFAPIASFNLLKDAYDNGVSLGIKEKLKVGNILTADLFYSDEGFDKWTEYGVLGADMESAELYTLGAKFGVEVLSIMTVSDHILKGEQTTPQERQESFDEMIKVALSLIK